MSTFNQTIKKFANASKLEIEIVDERFVYLTILNGRLSTLGVGMLDQQYIEFRIPLSSDFNTLIEMPAQVSMYFMSRNIPIQIGHWSIDYGQLSHTYFYALRFVTMLSSLNQQRFEKIIYSLEEEFKLYAKMVSGG